MDSLVIELYNKALDHYDKKEFKEALDIFDNIIGTSKTNSEKLEALRLSGWCNYFLGNISESQNFFEKSSKHGNPEATADIADFYMTGDNGYKKDNNIAIKLFTKACKNGSKYACKKLFALLKHSNVNRIDYISHHIGKINFIEILLGNNIGKLVSFLFKKRYIK